MATRHVFPEGVLPDLRMSSEPEQPPSVSRKPYDVAFRNGKDLKTIAEEISGRYMVRVSAAVGSGKSTVLPRELNTVVGVPVLHVLPSRVLAVALFDYLSTLGTGVDYKLSLSNTDVYSTTGVTLTYSAAVWSRMLSVGMSAKPLGKSLLYLDESHESDAYTYALQKVAHNISGVHGVVFASANHDVDRLPMRETHGTVESMKFPSGERTNTWEPLANGKPWSVSELTGNMLLFVEPSTDANMLVSKYNKAGVAAYRLTAGMDIQLFREAVRASTDPKGGIVVFVADYSFRSGFTFNVTTIVDSALVGYYEVMNGSQQRKYRPAYALERYQAQGRAGRTPGSHCVCWYPDVVVESALCRLEGVEADVAAVLFRLAGFSPTPEIRMVSFAIGKVPKDIVHSFNDSMALILQPESVMWDLVHVPRVMADEIHAREMAAVVASYAEEDEVLPDLFKAMDVKASEHALIMMPDANEALKELMQLSAIGSCIVPPAYYMVPGLECVPTDTRIYGEDWKRLLKDLQLHPEMARGYANSDMKEVIVLLLNTYNMMNATVVGLTRVACYKESIGKASAMHPGVVHNWVEQVSERLRVGECTRNALVEVLNQVLPASMRFSRVEPFREVEEQVMKNYAQELIAAIRDANKQLDVDSYGKNMMERIATPGFRAIASDGVEIVNDDKQMASVTLLPVKVARRRMYEIEVKPSTSVGWSVGDYADSIISLLTQKNMNPRMIANVHLPDSVTDRDKMVVMARVHDTPLVRKDMHFTVAINKSAVAGN